MPTLLPEHSFLGQSGARAGGTYVETSAGAVKLVQGDSFFGYGGNAPGLGVTFPVTMAFNLISSHSAQGLHLGLQHRFSTASVKATATNGAASYNMQTTYLILRLATRGFFIGGGYTPFVLKNGFNRARGSTSTLAEAGIGFPVTPELDIIAHGSAEWVSTGTIRSPFPAFSASVGLRFFVGRLMQGQSAADRDWSGYSGWRYPFGMEKN